MVPMKDPTVKLLPIVIGLFIGWLLFHPPDFLAPLGAGRYLVMALAGAVLLVASVVMTVAASLPRQVSLTPGVEPGDPAFRSLVDRYRALGFEPVGPAFTVGIAPAAALVGLVHRAEAVYGTVFKTGTVPAVVSSDFVSLLEDDRGGLTTSASPRGGALPGDAGSFRQCLVGATPEQLFQAHCEGVRWLRTRGLRCRPVSASSFAADFGHAVARQRAIFMADPVGNALRAIWRTASDHAPGRGRLGDQPGVDGQVRRLLASGR